MKNILGVVWDAVWAVVGLILGLIGLGAACKLVAYFFMFGWRIAS